MLLTKYLHGTQGRNSLETSTTLVPRIPFALSLAIEGNSVFRLSLYDK